MPDRPTGSIVGSGMQLVSVSVETAPDTNQSVKTAAIAWAVAAVYYFYQYVRRSAPSVMMPQLSEPFGPEDISSIVRFAANLANIERVDVLPFYQMGEFKWKDLKLSYPLDDVLPPSRQLAQSVGQLFRAQGLTAY